MREKKNIKIKPIITIVCDDVRMENNAKPLLIGIYTGGITLAGPMPDNSEELSNLSVFLWIPYEVQEAGVAKFEIKIIQPDPKHQLKLQGQIEVDGVPLPTELMPLVLGPLPLKLWQNGNLQVLFKHEDEKDYQTLKIIPVIFKVLEEDPNFLTSSSVPVQPS